MRIVVAGHSCVDLVPRLRGAVDPSPGAFAAIGELAIRAGGSVANTGRALAELGCEVEIVTTVGDDALGPLLRDELGRISSACTIERTPEVGTSYSLVLEHDGLSRTIWHHVGSAAVFTGDAVDPTGAALVHLGYPPALPGLLTDDARPFRTLIARVREAGATMSVDMSVVPETEEADWIPLLTDLLPGIDVITPSVDDLTSIGWLPAAPSPVEIAEGAHRMLAAGAAVVMVSDGERGAYLCASGADRLAAGGRVTTALGDAWPGHRSWVEPEPVASVATTNGAGDAATAGLLFALLSGYAPAEAGRLAARVAARRIGGDPADERR